MQIVAFVDGKSLHGTRFLGEEMPLFRLDVNKKSGIVTLLTETGCGMKPVFVWTELDGVKEFAEMLLNFYSDALLKENNKIREISEHILRQALEDDNGTNDIS